MSELCTLKIISPSSSIQTCFFYFNENGIRARLKNFTKNNFTLKIGYGENYSQYIYGSFAPQSRNELADGCIGLCSKFAYCLNLNEGAQLLVSSCDVIVAKAVYVSPMHKDDFTILDEEKDALEETILNQVRVISRYQCVPIQVYANIFINLHVEKLEPDIEYGLLVEDTELRIMPYQERKKEVPVKPLGNSSNPVANYIKRVTDNFSANIENDNNDETLQRKLAQIKTEYRIVSSTELENDIPFNIRNKYVIIHHFPKKNFYGPCYLKLKCRIENVNEFVFNSYVICLNDSSDNLLYCPIYLLRKHKIPLGAKVHLEEVKNVKCEKELKIDLRRDPTWAQNIKDNIIETINDNIKYRQNINSLIIGNAGTGKTYLINSISNELRINMIFCGQIDCRPLRGKKIETLLKLLNEKLSECSRNQPSALIIDDLDALTYLSEENEQQFNLLYSSRIGEMLTSCIRSYQRHSISIIATASKLSQLGSLATIRGPRLFENVEEISEMEMQDRSLALKNIASSKNFVLDQKLLDHVVEKTIGYNIQDLVDLVENAIFNSLMRTSKTSEINQEDFDDALKETIPLSLRGVELHKNIPNKWENIGGMNEAKKILIEVFAWPSKYPELFKSCPLRHQSGVLLYGAPGTGKTLIAGAVANECGMNFISIKGPELLSKYVGASEEGVRNLFIRAQKAQPCVLFFDEFDSLAPRRGHDSTGVTDRVVNQLLTQLDGVEALNGVWVLAATSRPDLLDPALLRPGRLDRTVYCALPDKDDRASILKALARKLRLADDVDFEEIAEKSEGYTGADLQAVLYSAQMIPIKKLKNQNLDNISGKSLIVTQDDLLKALEETKPSMTEKEKEKYRMIYERFISSRGADFADQTGKQKKITFA